jgi:hypothetical protein
MELECPLCKLRFILQGEEKAPPAEKPCPFCGNMINHKATRCKFCKQEVMGNGVMPYPDNMGVSNENPKRKLWDKIPLPARPFARFFALFLIAYLLLGTCSGVFYVWNDNHLIKAWKIEKCVQTYFSATGASHSLSPINCALDNIGSFFSGFFLFYGEDTFRNETRLLDKVLYRYGEHEALREVELKNLKIWYAAEKQHAENEGRYLDY